MGGRMLAHASGVSAMIALALGYIVCTLAGKEKGVLRKLGYIIGISIITISIFLILCKVLCAFGIYPKSTCPLKTQMQMQLPQK